MRVHPGFENEVMRMRRVVVAVAIAAIVTGIAAFVVGLRQPIEPPHAIELRR